MSSRAAVFIFGPTAAAISWSATAALVGATPVQQTAVPSAASPVLNLLTKLSIDSAVSNARITQPVQLNILASRSPNLKFLLVSMTSVSAFAISLLAATATFIPSISEAAADVSLLAMLGATTLGAWAAHMTQRSPASDQ